MKKIKEKISKSFKTLAFKRGSYSAIIAIIVIAIVVILNLAVRNLPASCIKYDLSKNDYYSIGNVTKEIVSNLDQDVNIYQIWQTGTEDSINEINTTLLEKYEELSDYIHVDIIDPELNTAFLNQYGLTSKDIGSIVVSSDLRSTVISYADICETSYDYSNYLTTGSTNTSYSYDGEGEITSAINYVTTDDIPVLYTLSGHGETALDTCISDAIEKAVFEIRDLSLINEGSIPEDCDCLAIIAPIYDLSKSESDMIINYLEAGGKALIMTTYNSKEELANFENVLSSYGVELVDGFVVDEDSDYNVGGYVDSLLPKINDHDITSSIISEDLYINVPSAQGLQTVGLSRGTLNFNTLLETSDSSYSLTDCGESANTTGVVKQGENDPSGPFAVGMFITEETDDDETMLAIYTSPYIIADDVTQNNSIANIGLITNTLKYMCDNDETSLAIDAKNLDSERNISSSSMVFVWGIITILIIPLLVIVIGIAVWIIRRKA